MVDWPEEHADECAWLSEPLIQPSLKTAVLRVSYVNPEAQPLCDQTPALWISLTP